MRSEKIKRTSKIFKFYNSSNEMTISDHFMNTTKEKPSIHN